MLFLDYWNRGTNNRSQRSFVFDDVSEAVALQADVVGS